MTDGPKYSILTTTGKVEFRDAKKTTENLAEIKNSWYYYMAGFSGGRRRWLHFRSGRYDCCVVSPRPTPASAPSRRLLPLADCTHRIVYLQLLSANTTISYYICLSASDCCHHCCRRHDRLASETVHPPQLRYCRRHSIGSWTIYCTSLTV